MDEFGEEKKPRRDALRKTFCDDDDYNYRRLHRVDVMNNDYYEKMVTRKVRNNDFGSVLFDDDDDRSVLHLFFAKKNCDDDDDDDSRYVPDLDHHGIQMRNGDEQCVKGMNGVGDDCCVASLAGKT